MQLRLIATLLVLFGSILPLRGQGLERPVEAATEEMVVDALKQLNCRFNVDEWKFNIEMGKRTFKLYWLDNGKRLALKASIKGQPSLQAINRYNEKTASTSRVVQNEKLGLLLESGVDCQLGITTAGIRKFVIRFVGEIGEFETFVANNKDVAPIAPIDVKPIVKGEKQKVPMNIDPGSDDKSLTITFPTGDAKWETAWKIIWDMESGEQANAQGYKTIKKVKGEDKEFPAFRAGRSALLFKIKKAYFKPGQDAEWIQVLEDAHPQEFYVPYYFKNTRFYDLRDVGSYVGLSAKEGGAISQPLSKAKNVMAELRDTGVAYKHGNITRRGEELTLWANFGAANYTYMIEYGFRDDGVIVFRHSPTGYNYFNHFDASHMHGSYWRLGVKLGPEGNNETNQVYSVNLPSDPKQQGDTNGKLDIKEITKESFLDWNAQGFTRIRVTNPNYTIIPEAKDRPPLPISYDLVTYPQGVARHKRNPDEKFSLHDYWITRADCPEKMYVNLGNYFFNETGAVSPKLRNLENQNVVLYHSSSALHTPRAEDGILKGNSTSNGQATVFWTTFEMRPRNLFLKTPIYRSLP